MPVVLARGGEGPWKPTSLCTLSDDTGENYLRTWGVLERDGPVTSTMTTTLKTFLLRGTLGPISLGIRKQDIATWLGKPRSVDAPNERKKQERFATWEYGPLQLGFHYDTLILIGLYFRSNSPLPRKLVIEGYLPNDQTVLENFESYLRDESVNYHVDLSQTNDAQIALEVGVGAHIYFDRETGRIDSIQLLNRRV